MHRYLSPAVLIFVLSLMASLSVHLPIYSALGTLARWFEKHQPDPPAPATVEFELSEQSLGASPATSPSQRDSRSDRKAQPEKPEPSKPVVKKTPPKKKEPERPQPPPKLAKKPPKPPPEPLHKQSIKQRSQDPEVEAPEDPRFIAKENQRVQEETIARLRNYQRDDPQPQAASKDSSDVPDEGNAREHEVADMRELQGSDARTPTPQEAAMERPRQASKEPPAGERVASSMQPEGDPRQTTQQSASGRTAAPEGTETVVVNDGMGSFKITRPNAGGGRAGKRGKAAGRRGNLGQGNLKLSWSDFEGIYGRAKLKKQRQAYLREKRTKLMGSSSRKKRWKEFRAAIENFVPDVRPGNQTALNAAASPFADYLASVHLRLHREFADEFLGSLPSGGASPYADRSLRAKLEIILNRDGTVHRVGIVRTSGFMPFDYGAFAAVMRAQPYPQAPSRILSGDGRVYIHWGFYRNERQCGTFNAEPYILPHPPDSPKKQGGPFRDKPEWGAVVPDERRVPRRQVHPGDSEPKQKHEHRPKGPSKITSPPHFAPRPRRPGGGPPPRGRGAAMG